MRAQRARATTAAPFGSLESCWSFAVRAARERLHFTAVRTFRLIFLIVSLLAAAVVAPPAFAQSYYDVEVVVFELLNANAVPIAPSNAAPLAVNPTPT